MSSPRVEKMRQLHGRGHCFAPCDLCWLLAAYDALTAERDRLRAALREFANPEHWEQIGDAGNESDHHAWNDWRNPMDVADAALAEPRP